MQFLQHLKRPTSGGNLETLSRPFCWIVTLLNLLRTNKQKKKSPSNDRGIIWSTPETSLPKKMLAVSKPHEGSHQFFSGTSGSSPGFMELKTALHTCQVCADLPHTFSTNLTPSTWIYHLQKYAVPGEKSPDHHDGDMFSNWIYVHIGLRHHTDSCMLTKSAWIFNMS